MKTTNISQKSVWQILDASVTGTSHQKVNRDCEDKYHFDQYENGTLLLAVADGAGSASHASDGAQHAVNKALETIKDSFEQEGEPNSQDEWSNRLQWVLDIVHISLQELADSSLSEHTEFESTQIIEPLMTLPFNNKDSEIKEGAKNISSSLSLREYATTLLLAVVTSQWIAIAQIGDGIVIVQDNNGKLQMLTLPDHGEYINETSFITDAKYREHVQFFVKSDISVKGIALLTDGLQMLALDFATNLPHEPFFSPLFEIAATQTGSSKLELENFLSSERVCERTDDDKTIVLAVRA